MLKICQRDSKNMWDLCQNMLMICQIYGKYMQNICQRYA
jgi:hypothetical protein